jgi:hypothetical protein
LSRVLGNGHALVLRGVRHSNVSGLPVRSSNVTDGSSGYCNPWWRSGLADGGAKPLPVLSRHSAAPMNLGISPCFPPAVGSSVIAGADRRSLLARHAERHVGRWRSETVLARSQKIRAARQILRVRLDPRGRYEAPAAAGPASVRAAARTRRRRRNRSRLMFPPSTSETLTPLPPPRVSLRRSIVPTE